MTEFDYDPEKALWKPGRRSFLFMFGAAAVGSLLPAPSFTLTQQKTVAFGYSSAQLVIPQWVTKEVARHFIQTVRTIPGMVDMPYQTQLSRGAWPTLGE